LATEQQSPRLKQRYHAIQKIHHETIEPDIFKQKLTSLLTDITNTIETIKLVDVEREQQYLTNMSVLEQIMDQSRQDALHNLNTPNIIQQRQNHITQLKTKLITNQYFAPYIA
jgi:hypothetical protein